jgi:predicted ATP-grasp superfamily ATP-dependent carboligase
LTEKLFFSVRGQPHFNNPSMLISWNEDAAKLGTTTIEYIIKKLAGEGFGEIEPEGFFSLGGVAVENNVAQFPEIKFFYCKDRDLVLLKSNSPVQEWYKFLTNIMEVAENVCHVKEIFTLGGMVTFTSHLTSRALITSSNSLQMKKVMYQYDIAKNINYESPPGQRPSLSNYLLWVAKRRNINAASLWVPIPFYLIAIKDMVAVKKLIDFLDRKMELKIDLAELDEAVTRYNEQLANILNRFPDLNVLLQRIDNGAGLSEEESSKLVRVMQENLGRND